MTREYFENHVDMIVELDGDYGKHRTCMKASEVNKYLDNLSEGEYFSDCDYRCKQSDSWVRKVLNTANYNWTNNRDWLMKKNFTSFDDVVNYIIDNNLVA